MNQRDTERAMSEENVEIVRRAYRAMDAADLGTIAELVHPDAEWVPDARVGEAPVRGRESVTRFFADRAEMFEGVRTELERITDIGDQVLVFLRVTGHGRASGAGFDVRIAHLWTLSDGRLTRGEGYGSRDEALEAAGLSE
jgi:ketosteroid isomerase-like protein